MMMESGAMSADFLKFMAEDSGNVAADGNFSIQVQKQRITQVCAHGRSAPPPTLDRNNEFGIGERKVVHVDFHQRAYTRLFCMKSLYDSRPTNCQQASAHACQCTTISSSHLNCLPLRLPRDHFILLRDLSASSSTSQHL